MDYVFEFLSSFVFIKEYPVVNGDINFCFSNETNRRLSYIIVIFYLLDNFFEHFGVVIRTRFKIQTSSFSVT